MFFNEKVKTIKPRDYVLEIGPGGTPHPRSDIFLDIDPASFPDEIAAGYQRGNAPQLVTDKPIIYYDGKKFPFKDQEFDYVICAHVLEHVENLPSFLKEVFRISKAGYFEYPTIYYEYLYSIPVHYNILKKNDNALHYIKKSDTSLSDFNLVQMFLLESLGKGHTKMVDDLKEYMFEGFEWFEPFKLKRVKSINTLTIRDYDLPLASPYDPSYIWNTDLLLLQRVISVRLFKKVVPKFVREELRRRYHARKNH